MRATWILALGVVFGPWGLADAGARTWHVLADGTGDAPTVQAGIDSSAHGDVVLVGPGTYQENLNLLGKRIHLKGEMGPAATTLDGSGAPTSVIECWSGETNETIIEGFTITGGTGVENQRWGGGVLCSDAWPIVRGNIIRSNHLVAASGWGGGVFIGDTDISGNVTIIEDNVIEENTATWSSPSLAHLQNRQSGRLAGEVCDVWKAV